MCPTDAQTRPRGTFLAEVLANERLCDEHYLLRLGVTGFPPSRPGQFVQVQCRRPDLEPRPRVVDWPDDRPPKLTQPDLVQVEALLRRPFSIARRRDLDGPSTGSGRAVVARRAEIEIIYRVVGSGTAWLERLAAGQPVSVLGPLGNAFAIDQHKPAAALVGGGVGIPPLIYLAEALAACGKDVKAFCGVRSANLLPLRIGGAAEVSPDGSPTSSVVDFAAHGVQAAIATDDGSLGWRGLAAELFRRWLEAQDGPAGRLVVYSCGPEAMMRAVGEACIARGVECQLALERHMACGMGTCQSCIVKIRADCEAGWEYKLACTDGPVFSAEEILWD